MAEFEFRSVAAFLEGFAGQMNLPQPALTATNGKSNDFFSIGDIVDFAEYGGEYSAKARMSQAAGYREYQPDSPFPSKNSKRGL